MKAHLVIAALAALAAPAAAEINMADTVEWQTVDADVVVRGFAASRTKDTVTIQITETLKGSVKKSVVVRTAAKLPDKADLLLFLDRERDGLVPRAQHGDDHSIFVLGTHRAYTIAFDALTKPTDVLAAVRRAATSRGTTSLRLDVPGETPAMKALYGGSSVFVTVPLDSAMERQAATWITHENQHWRSLGATVLANFSSKETIGRMRGLLTDPGFIDVAEPGKPTVRRYHIRAIAHDALVTWKIDHPTPVLEDLVISRP